MPIIANNFVVVDKADANSSRTLGPLDTRIPQESGARIEGTALVVNGKAKKISKKSAYLMDMLTLDDE